LMTASRWRALASMRPSLSCCCGVIMPDTPYSIRWV
jgi:hypothetical protein